MNTLSVYAYGYACVCHCAHSVLHVLLLVGSHERVKISRAARLSRRAVVAVIDYSIRSHTNSSAAE